MIAATAAAGGCLGGVLATVGVYKFQAEHKSYNKETHPHEYAVFKRLDQNGTGYVNRKAIAKLCHRMEMHEFADLLEKLTDPWRTNRITFKQFCQRWEAVEVMRNGSRLKLWHRCVGLGVAGNVAGHMAQAGEASKGGPKETKPAALFSFYNPCLPWSVTDELAEMPKLSVFPVAYSVIRYPDLATAKKIQVEPEMGLYVDVVYSADRTKVEKLVPRRVAIMNDCSIRSLEGAVKLSQKKNWGSASTGISLRSFEIETMAKGSFVDNLVIESYVKRDGQIHQYSVTAPVRNYLCFNDELLQWITDTINTQTDCDKWEPIFQPTFADCGYPTSAWIACGAGQYTDWGNTYDLTRKDEVVIMLYDERVFSKGMAPDLVEALFEDKSAPPGMVHLHQTFI